MSVVVPDIFRQVVEEAGFELGMHVLEVNGVLVKAYNLRLNLNEARACVYIVAIANWHSSDLYINCPRNTVKLGNHRYY